MLHITHDVGETWGFPRVLVVEQGRIVEDGPPEALYSRAGSRYRELVDAEESGREQVWSDPSWRKLAMEDGRVREEVSRERTTALSKEVVC